MELQTFLHELISSTETIVQVLAAFYLAIAVFSGEQLAGAFKNRDRQIRLNPKRYIEFLNLWAACTVALSLVALVCIFNSITEQTMGISSIIALELLFLVLLFVAIIGDTLRHQKIEKKFKYISGSSSRLVAWALSKEKHAEKLKLIEVLLSDHNDTDLQKEVLTHLHDATSSMIKRPRKDQYTHLLATLRVLRSQISIQPLQDVEYHKQLFNLSHGLWIQALHNRNKLHKHNIYQLSGTLAGVSRELLHVSLEQFDLEYDYMKLLQDFLQKQSRDDQKLYMKRIGNDLLDRLIQAPGQEYVWEEFPMLQIDPSKRLNEQHPVAEGLVEQFLDKTSGLPRQMDFAMGQSIDGLLRKLFPSANESLLAQFLIVRTKIFNATTFDTKWVKELTAELSGRQWGYVSFNKADINYTAMLIKNLNIIPTTRAKQLVQTLGGAHLPEEEKRDVALLLAVMKKIAA